MTLYTSKSPYRHERGSDDNPIQIVADLISSNMSPFTPDDESALRNLTTETLKKLRNQFLANNSSPCMICGGAGVVKNDLFPDRTIPCSCQNPVRDVPEPPSLREAINARRRQKQPAVSSSSGDDAASIMGNPPGVLDAIKRRR